MRLSSGARLKVGRTKNGAGTGQKRLTIQELRKLQELGYKRLTLESDDEPAILKLKDDSSACLPVVDGIFKETPAGDRQRMSCNADMDPWTPLESVDPLQSVLETDEQQSMTGRRWRRPAVIVGESILVKVASARPWAEQEWYRPYALATMAGRECCWR